MTRYEWIKEKVSKVGRDPKGQRECIEAISPYAGHRYRDVRFAIAKAIYDFGNRRDYPIIKKFLSDRDPLIRAVALESLWMCGQRLALPHLRRSFENEKHHLPEMCGVRALNDFEPTPEIVQLLEEKMLRNPSEEVKGAAAMVRFEWYGDLALGGVLFCFRSDDFYCYMRPIWHWGTELPDLKPHGTRLLRQCLLELADELDAEKCPEWQAKEARALAERLEANLYTGES